MPGSETLEKRTDNSCTANKLPCFKFLWRGYFMLSKPWILDLDRVWPPDPSNRSPVAGHSGSRGQQSLDWWKIGIHGNFVTDKFQNWRHETLSLKIIRFRNFRHNIFSTHFFYKILSGIISVQPRDILLSVPKFTANLYCISLTL